MIGIDKISRYQCKYGNEIVTSVLIIRPPVILYLGKRISLLFRLHQLIVPDAVMPRSKPSPKDNRNSVPHFFSDGEGQNRPNILRSVYINNCAQDLCINFLPLVHQYECFWAGAVLPGSQPSPAYQLFYSMPEASHNSQSSNQEIQWKTKSIIESHFESSHMQLKPTSDQKSMK